MNHPAGRIGKRLILRVADLMLRGGAVPVVPPATLMPEVLVQLSAKGCGCVLVADAGGALLGIFTDGDLRRTLQSVRARSRGGCARVRAAVGCGCERACSRGVLLRARLCGC